MSLSSGTSGTTCSITLRQRTSSAHSLANGRKPADRSRTTSTPGRRAISALTYPDRISVPQPRLILNAAPSVPRLEAREPAPGSPGAANGAVRQGRVRVLCADLVDIHVLRFRVPAKRACGRQRNFSLTTLTRAAFAGAASPIGRGEFISVPRPEGEAI